MRIFDRAARRSPVFLWITSGENSRKLASDHAFDPCRALSFALGRVELIIVMMVMLGGRLTNWRRIHDFRGMRRVVSLVHCGLMPIGMIVGPFGMIFVDPAGIMLMPPVGVAPLMTLVVSADAVFRTAHGVLR